MKTRQDRCYRSPWRGGRLLLALLLGGSTALAQAGPVRLVLDTGTVIPLNAGGSDFAGEFGQIPLPRDQQIHAVAADYVNGRLYVTLTQPQPHYVTQVHDIVTLKQLDSLDDVVEVVVPDDDKARTLLTRHYVPDQNGRYNGDVLSLLMMISPGRPQLRERRRYEQVLSEGADDREQYELLPRCHAGGKLPFLTTRPPWRLDRQFEPAFPPGEINADAERERTTGVRRSLQACLPGGDTLELEYKPRGLFQQCTLHALVQRHGKREVRRYPLSEGPFDSPLQSQHARLLGEDSRFLVLPGLDFAVDLKTGARTNNVADGLRWTQRSADRSRLYSFPRYYNYRSILSEEYTEGGSPWYCCGVGRLSLVDGALHRDTLPLPPLLQETLDRNDQRLAAFRARLELRQAQGEDYVDDEANHAAEAEQLRLNEPTSLEQRLGRFSIIAVLDP